MRPVALITGASAGIGAELARVFAAHGHELVLVARREGLLAALAEEIAAAGRQRPTVLGLDLGRRDAVSTLAAELTARGLEPEIVVNNAGFGLVGPAAALSRDEQLAMIDLNARALTELSLAFVESLARHRGGILNVASVAAFMPGPGMAVYYASKAYVLSFSEALHHELSRRGVRVTALCPGPVPTEFQARAGLRADRAQSVLLSLSAERVARIGYRGFMRGKRVVVAGIGNQIVRISGADRASRGGSAAAPLGHAVCGSQFRAATRTRVLNLRMNAIRGGVGAPSIPSIMPQPILIILHQEHSTPGRVGYALQRLGYGLDVRRPRFGDPLPATLREHAAAIIFGGPMSANDADEFIRCEIDWIAVPLKEDKPFLGICLGAQMCARALGGRVFPHPAGQAEIGYYPIRPTAAGLAVVSPWPEQVYQWHREGFDLPDGAELLAEGDMFEVQAFRYGRSYALQFHPDVTHLMMHKWTTSGHLRLEMPGAKPRAAHFADREVYDYSARAWLSVFLERWIGG